MQQIKRNESGSGENEIGEMKTVARRRNIGVRGIGSAAAKRSPPASAAYRARHALASRAEMALQQSQSNGGIAAASA